MLSGNYYNTIPYLPFKHMSSTKNVSFIISKLLAIIYLQILTHWTNMFINLNIIVLDSVNISVTIGIVIVGIQICWWDLFIKYLMLYLHHLVNFYGRFLSATSSVTKNYASSFSDMYWFFFVMYYLNNSCFNWVKCSLFFDFHFYFSWYT